MKKSVIKISGLDCASCAMIIDDVLEELNGVKSAKTSFVKEQVEVEFEEKLISIEKIKKIILKSGFQIAV